MGYLGIMGEINRVGNHIGLLAVEDLALVVHKSPASIRSDASRNPDALPPICRLPGNKRLLWRREDVLAWVAQFVHHNPASDSGASAFVLDIPKKRGRPRKTESRDA